MEIVIDLLPLTGGNAGLQRYGKQLVRSLARNDSKNEYTLLVNDRTPVSLLLDAPNFAVAELKLPTKAPFVWNQVYLPKYLLARDFDIVHSPVSPPVYFTPGAKYVVTIHDLTFDLYPDTMTDFARFYWSTFTKYGLRNVDSIITVSENTKQDVVDRYGVNDQRVTAIPLAIDDELSRSVSPDEAREVLSRYSIEEPYLLYVGTIEPRKNIPRLIRAFDRAKTRYRFNHKLVIVGKKGWLFDDVFDIVQELGISDQVVFTGFVPDEDLPGLYGSADGFVFPSLYEGFGLPPLEAMSYGTPVIVANSSSLPEVVGDAGLLIDPENVDDIADKIARLATNENLRGELERKGRERARTFSLDRLAKKTLEVYHETVE